MILNWQPLNGWVGSIKSVCIARLVMCHLLRLNDGIMIVQPCQASLPDSSQPASDKVGAAQF